MKVNDSESRISSLWTLVSKNLPESERDEVKAALGDDLVDQSVELKIEIDTLLEIYESYSKERAAGDNTSISLPEPPELRHRLMVEIQFFVQNIRDHAKSQGMNPDRALDNHNSEIIDYAYESASSRPTTSDSSYLSTSRSSFRETPVSERINTNLMKEKINYMDFDEVRDNLRQFLQDEVDQLNLELLELQKSIYNDDINQSQRRLDEPTISELKKERHDLEQLLLQSSQHKIQKQLNIPIISNRLVANKVERKSLFKFRPDNESIENVTSRNIQSPPRLIPIDQKIDEFILSYEKSPLDLGLPETSSSIQELINSNNSSLVISTLSQRNSPINKLRQPTPPICKSNFFNSAQKFRQRVLQNRKESRGS